MAKMGECARLARPCGPAAGCGAARQIAARRPFRQ